MRAALALLAAALAAGPCFAGQGPDKSDLGEQGNLFVAKTFSAYRRLHPEGACRAAGPGTRVLVTGYGLFSGVPYNVSGTVVRSMADPAFWPERVELDEPSLAALKTPRAGLVLPADAGAAAFNRSLYIDGKRYEACFLVLDVIWDLAGAIVVHEESRFKPEVVVMTGRGGSEASFEAGALNRASPFPGYDADGKPLGSINVPESKWVVADEPADAELPMTWDALALAEAAAPRASRLGYSAIGQARARPENNYLCNDVSFVALHASRNRPTSLAGGLVLLGSPELPRTPAVGFLHFPAVDAEHPDLAAYASGIDGWARILAGTIARAAAK
ncbi:MAG TPA: hypothetical protein VN915_09360 [Elusimicrobiota bacterium]|nr:hypothetical protein [Elusimicrobiota bacterium]